MACTPSEGVILVWVFGRNEPHIKYYFVNKLDDNDKYGAVIPAKSNELVEKLLEDTVK